MYWKLLEGISPFKILAHRIVWTFVFGAVLVTIARRWREVGGTFKTGKTFRLCLAAAALLSTNWVTFIYAVNTGRVMECSLGYYINPLVNVLLGFLFLKERFRPLQFAAILLACAAVLYVTISYGSFPWISLLLAFSFSFYGLIRKTVQYESLTGMVLESALMSMPALALFFFTGFFPLNQAGEYEPQSMLILSLAGVVTALPLLTYAFGARRIRYTTVGFIQYLTPTCMFLLAVFLYREPFSTEQLVSFSCIWTALAVYSWDTAASVRR